MVTRTGYDAIIKHTLNALVYGCTRYAALRCHIAERNTGVL
jgi:hypothetical protein